MKFILTKALFVTIVALYAVQVSALDSNECLYCDTFPVNDVYYTSHKVVTDTQNKQTKPNNIHTKSTIKAKKNNKSTEIVKQKVSIGSTYLDHIAGGGQIPMEFRNMRYRTQNLSRLLSRYYTALRDMSQVSADLSVGNKVSLNQQNFQKSLNKIGSTIYWYERASNELHQEKSRFKEALYTREPEKIENTISYRLAKKLQDISDLQEHARAIQQGEKDATLPAYTDINKARSVAYIAVMAQIERLNDEVNNDSYGMKTVLETNTQNTVLINFLSPEEKGALLWAYERASFEDVEGKDLVKSITSPLYAIRNWYKTLDATQRPYKYITGVGYQFSADSDKMRYNALLEYLDTQKNLQTSVIDTIQKTINASPRYLQRIQTITVPDISQYQL